MESDCHLDMPFEIQPINTGSCEILVLRDDLLPGGSKERACVPYLNRLKHGGVNKIVYASPFAGFAQVALALSAKRLDLPCFLICEEDKTAAHARSLHPFSAKAAETGAEIIVVHNLAAAEAAATEIAREVSGYKIPLGFNDDMFRNCFEQAISSLWSRLPKNTAANIRRVWTPIGSGTLATCLRKVLDPSIELCLVDVRVLEETDARIARIKDAFNVTYFRAVEAFHQRSEAPPPLPSNIHYDAKLWRMIQRQGRTGDLWWNVAR